MVLQYKTVHEGRQGEIEEKKSRFIASVSHVESEEEAAAFLESVRKRYYDARHHCYAYCLGEKGAQKRFSDDGEPSQTAGKPILDVLEGMELTDTIVVVTRYFGGTLLGTGGLVRAYTAAAREGLNNSVIIEKKLANEVWVTVDYSSVGRLLYLAGQKGYAQLDSDYAADVTLVLLVPAGETTAMEKEFTDAFGGRAQIRIEGQLYYAKAGKELLLFR